MNTVYMTLWDRDDQQIIVPLTLHEESTFCVPAKNKALELLAASIDPARKFIRYILPSFLVNPAAKRGRLKPTCTKVKGKVGNGTKPVLRGKGKAGAKA